MGNTPLVAPPDTPEAMVDRSNIALVFVKPHANNEKCRAFVSGELQSRGLSILAEGDLDAATIKEKGIIDKHYRAIAKCAMETHPSELSLSADKKKEFQAKFGKTWDELMDLGLVHNAKAACEKLGTMDGDNLVPLTGGEMQKLWAKAGGGAFKLGPGLYVGNIGTEEPLFVVNGFYANMRDKYVKGAGVHYYAVGFDPSVLSWKKFRGEVIGATDPTAADPASIRGMIFARGEADLGLPGKPDVTDNGVHASAGPIEALRERCTWLGYAVEEDPFAKVLMTWTGFNAKQLEPWLNDEVVEEKVNNKVKGKMFDVTEDKDSTYAVMLCNNLARA